MSSQAPDTEQAAVVESAAAARGTLTLDAQGLGKDFRLGRGHVLHAVRDVSLGLYRSAVVALVGESGSGKSTVARMLAGQEHPTTGTIRLDEHPVELSGRRAFRSYKSEVQYVFQDPFASLNPVQGRMSREQLSEQATALMEQVRLSPADKYLGKYPHELSGGQRQRVSFARALAAKPRVLLADEPVSMLDVSIRLEMLALLDDLRQRLQLAMLYITHDIASARYFADEILVMYAGQIVEQGPAEEVTQQPAHPYTQLLVSSAPDPDNLGGALRNGARTDHQTGNGAVSIATGPAPEGACSFSPRCPFAVDKCRAEAPPLIQISRSRAAACWRLDVAAPSLYSEPRGGGDLTS
jgi:peptide/nickel transport system ATP-binding protein